MHSLVGEALYNIYALIGMIRYESRRYLSKRVVRVNFPRLILGLKEAPFSFFLDSEDKYTISGE